MSLDKVKSKQVTVDIGGTPTSLQDAITTIKVDVANAEAASSWGNISGTLSSQTDLQAVLNNKVTVESGKVLSDNNYTTAEKNKLATAATTSDISSAVANKVDKEAGKGLIAPAPVDGKIYGQVNGGWSQVVVSGVPEAPVDGKQYARKDAAWAEVTGGGSGGGVFTELNFDQSIPNTLAMSNFPDVNKRYTGTVRIDLGGVLALYPFDDISESSVKGFMESVGSRYHMEPMYKEDGEPMWLQKVSGTPGYGMELTVCRVVSENSVDGTYIYDSWYMTPASVNYLLEGRMRPAFIPEDLSSGITRGVRDGEWVPLTLPTIFTEDTSFVVNSSTELQQKVSELASCGAGIKANGLLAVVKVKLSSTYVLDSTVRFSGDHSWYTIENDNHDNTHTTSSSLDAIYFGQNAKLPQITNKYSAPNATYGVYLDNGSLVWGGLFSGISGPSYALFARNSDVLITAGTFTSDLQFINSKVLASLVDVGDGAIVSNVTFQGGVGALSLDGGSSKVVATGCKVYLSAASGLQEVVVNSGGEVSIPSSSSATLSQLPNELTSAGIIFK